ncbi:serine hydrolase domain-containing protein [Bacteroidota bacterium]
MQIVKLFLAILLFMIITVSCSVNDSTNEEEIRYPEAVEQNIDPQGLTDAYDILTASPDTRCLLVERNGVLVQEEYLNGYTAERFYDLRSVTKSIISILIGIAIDQGSINSVDETIEDYLGDILPDLEPEKGALTIRHLITMTTGLPWRELGYTSTDFSSWVTSDDQIMWILDKPLFDTPGEYWNYNTGASHILSAILTSATGLSAKDFAQQYLLTPLEGEVGDWSVDSRDNNFGGHGINFTAPDMIKIGRMMLNGGVYNGTQIVSAEWIEESTQFLYSTNWAVPYGNGYGYLWWMGFDGATGTTFFWAMGYGGQFLICIPEYNTVIAAATRWSGVQDADNNWNWVLTTIVENVFPALQ